MISSNIILFIDSSKNTKIFVSVSPPSYPPKPFNRYSFINGKGIASERMTIVRKFVVVGPEVSDQVNTQVVKGWRGLTFPLLDCLDLTVDFEFLYKVTVEKKSLARFVDGNEMLKSLIQSKLHW